MKEDEELTGKGLPGKVHVRVLGGVLKKHSVEMKESLV